MSLTNHKSLSLDHLGLVAGMYDELGIGETIDAAIQQDTDRRNLSLGQAVKAMVLNGLGFVNQNLYLVPHFFANKPTEMLIGTGILPEHINDDVLGRALDDLYDYGVTDLFYAAATKATKALNLSPTFAHLDSTSFHVDGDYANSGEDAKGVHITRGYSRDHRPDLKQVILNLVVENQAGIPLLMKPADRNSQDKKGFRELINQHIDQLQQSTPVDYIVADSALYSEESIQDFSHYQTHWITRVPETIKLAKEAISQTDKAAMVALDDNYRIHSLLSNYGGVEQRWLVVYSQAAQNRSKHTLQKQFLQHSEKEHKAFAKLCRIEFACREDAQKALLQQLKRFKKIHINEVEIIAQQGYSKPGRPLEDSLPDREYFQITGTTFTRPNDYYQALHQKSCFIVATNQLDESTLDNQKLLENYKGQSKVEKGFRFLKDPMFLADALFLKNSHRIVALMMVMTLCLMIYAALEYRVRLQLRNSGKYFPSQTGKPTNKPTMRWVFNYFYGIHIWITGSTRMVVNLDQNHLMLIRLLGEPYQFYYS